MPDGENDYRSAHVAAAETAEATAALTIEQAERDLADVERALGRLDDGTYWSCEVCGAAIDGSLLAAQPTTRLCPAHDPNADGSGHAGASRAWYQDTIGERDGDAYSGGGAGAR